MLFFTCRVLWCLFTDEFLTKMYFIILQHLRKQRSWCKTTWRAWTTQLKKKLIILLIIFLQLRLISKPCSCLCCYYFNVRWRNGRSLGARSKIINYKLSVQNSIQNSSTIFKKAMIHLLLQWMRQMSIFAYTMKKKVGITTHESPWIILWIIQIIALKWLSRPRIFLKVPKIGTIWIN